LIGLGPYPADSRYSFRLTHYLCSIRKFSKHVRVSYWTPNVVANRTDIVHVCFIAPM